MLHFPHAMPGACSSPVAPNFSPCAAPRRAAAAPCRTLASFATARSCVATAHRRRRPAAPDRTLPEARRAEKLDLGGRVVLPGFVDSHTHLIYAESRAAEYEQRIAGATLRRNRPSRRRHSLQRAQTLRRATRDDLKARALAHLAPIRRARHHHLEAKSRLRPRLRERNARSWKSSANCAREQPLEIAPTFLGAHVVPPEFRKRPDEYVRPTSIHAAWIPQGRAQQASRNSATSIAIAARSPYRKSRRILTAGLRLRPRAAHPRRAARAHRRRAPRRRNASRQRRPP